MDLVPRDGRDPGLSEVIQERRSELTVVVADDDVGTRIGVRRILESSGIRVLADVTNAAEAVAAALAHGPDICLLAAEIPGSGILAAERIRQALPATKIVMLSTSDREEEMFAAFRAGADGHLPKTIPAARLPHALRGVANGEAALSRRLTTRLIREFYMRGTQRRLEITIAGRPIELTAREFEILERMRHDDPTAMMAEKFRISEVTVRRHVSAIVHKLGARDRRGAIQLLKAE
jgi:DNA-binding NarL/FixJ family response regulator